jgi:hypothetical protein
MSFGKELKNCVYNESFSKEILMEFTNTLICKILNFSFKNIKNIDWESVFYSKKDHDKNLNIGQISILFLEIKKNKLRYYTRVEFENGDTYYTEETEIILPKQKNDYEIINRGFPVELYFDWKNN